MKMSPKQFEKWAKIREKGRTRYIWVNGVLGWGLTTGVLWAVVMAALQGWKHLALFLTLAAIGFPIGGYFFGRWTWSLFEKQFEQASRNEPDA